MFTDTDTISFLPELDATLKDRMLDREFDRKMVSEHNLYEWEGHDGSWILEGFDEGVENDCGVYTENVYKFKEADKRGYVEIELCKDGGFILYEFTYMIGNYGHASPLSRPCFSCHRQNSIRFLCEQIYRSFAFSVLGADHNVDDLKDHQKLLSLCLKCTSRIEKELPRKEAV